MNLHDYFERATTKSSKSAANIDLLRKMNVLDRDSSISPEQWEVTCPLLFFYLFFCF